MDHLFGTLVLGIAAMFCLVTTWSSATAPRVFAARIGLAVADPGGVNEVRAQYGGFFFAVAVVCVAALAGMVARQTAFVGLATVFGGLILGRVCSLGMDGGVAGYGATIRALHAIDAVGFGLAVAAIFLG